MEEVKRSNDELIRGPRGKLIPTLPPRTKLLGLELSENGIAKVNFNHALLKDHPGGSSAEMMTVYSMTNTLTLNFPQIKQSSNPHRGRDGRNHCGTSFYKRACPP